MTLVKSDVHLTEQDLATGLNQSCFDCVDTMKTQSRRNEDRKDLTNITFSEVFR